MIRQTEETPGHKYQTIQTPHKPRMELPVQSLLSGKSVITVNRDGKQAGSRQEIGKQMKRRALLQPVVRPKEVEMTQGERLAEAVETERQNVLSLNQSLRTRNCKEGASTAKFNAEAS